MEIKVYIVQRETGEVVDAKLTHAAAHAVAKANAPAKVLLIRANKSPMPSSTQEGADNGTHRHEHGRDAALRFRA